MNLVKFEYQVRQFRKQGYSLRLICDDERVDKNGRVKLLDNKQFKFTIESEYKGITDKLEINI